MTSETTRERKGVHRYTFVVVPDAKAEKTRTFSMTRWGLVVTLSSAFLVVGAFLVAFILYTPIGTLLPIAHTGLERQYGKQIAEIQKQLTGLVREVTVLRSYNLRLRKALGERSMKGDSSISPRAEALQPPSGVRPEFRPDDHPGPVELPGTAGRLPFLQSEIAPAGILPLPLVPPADGYVSQEYDAERYHYGLDIAGKRGSSVVASADGRVMFSGWTDDGGFTIILGHDLGYTTVYRHNQALLKVSGDGVRRGELIATVGSTGRTSSGPHLHFEVWKDGAVLNPADYLVSIQ